MKDVARIYVEVQLPWKPSPQDRVCCAMALTDDQVAGLKLGSPPVNGPMDPYWSEWCRRYERSKILTRHLSENIAHQIQAFFSKDER